MEVPFEQTTSVCRGCLATGHGMLHAKRFEAEFKDVTGINISPADGLPQLLCYECSALLQKCARFRSKVIKTYNLLYQYVHQNITFQYEGSTSPHLSRTTIMYYEILDAQAEQTEDQTDGKETVTSVLDDSGATVSSKIAHVDIKIEPLWSNDEDDIKEESDVHVPERPGQESDVKNEVYESEQVAVKCEQIESSRDVTDRDELLHKCEIIAYYGQKDDKSHVISRHSDHLKRTLNRVNSSSQTNVQFFICDTCSRCFRTKVEIIKHVRLHLGDRSCKGDISKKRLSSTERNRINSGDKYKCDICMKCFNQKYTLTNHYRTHTGAKPYKCDVCMKSFRQKYDLIVHNRTHTGDKLFKCDAHMQNSTHAVGKQFKCDVCMKCFTNKRYLKSHSSIHTSKIPFKCDICMKCFTNKGNLNKHKSTHASEKQSICTKSFTCKRELIKHNRIQHKA